MVFSSDTNINNSGSNKGVIIAHNSGSVNVYGSNCCIISSLLPDIIKALSDICSIEEGDVSAINLEEYTVEEKIAYNHVIKHKENIELYAAYWRHCDQYLNELDNIFVGNKKKIMRLIVKIYSEVKGQILLDNRNSGKEDILLIQENADKIIDSVISNIRIHISQANNLSNLGLEDLVLGTTCLVAYFFVECKILERPHDCK